MLDLEQLIADVYRIVTEVGSFLREERKDFRRGHVVERYAHDYVSYVDKGFEVRVVKVLTVLLPEAGFIAEGGSTTYQNEPYYWMIDLLDGTMNYIHDEAPYCVSIALRNRTELPLGVVYKVRRNECFYAWKGGKAFMNGEEIHVLSVEDIKDAFIITELLYNHLQYRQTVLHLVDQLYGVVGGIRVSGSAVAAICYVVTGRFGVWVEALLGKWDYSAAALVVQGAGGKVADFYDEDHFIEGHHTTATSGDLYPISRKSLLEVPPLSM